MREIPRILVNLKLYEGAVGERALRVARAAKELHRETGVLIGMVPNPLDASKIAEEVEIPVFLQHVDAVPMGSHTGHLSPQLLKEYGLAGSIVNHSEMRMKLSDISWVVGALREEELLSVVCATSPEEALAVASLRPSAVAFEPPELIGTGISVSKAKPDAIVDTVSMVRSAVPTVKVLCGAGITDGEDVARALELGTHGVLLSSAVAKHPDPRKKLQELVRGVLKAKTP